MGGGQRVIADPSYRLVLLDELNIVLRYDYLPFEEVSRFCFLSLGIFM